MLQRHLLSFIACVLGFSLFSAHADLILPEVADAQKRFHDNPSLFDQTDQYCESKKINAACKISGTVFEGGGKGKCERELLDLKIALVCKRTESVTLDRKLPDIFSQTPPFPQVKDQFCAKLTAGSACTVTLLHNDKSEQYKGICKQQREERGYRLRPEVREVLSCEPLKPTPARVYKPVSAVKKLFSF